MKKKCGNCKYWIKKTFQSPGRNHGACIFTKDMQLPSWVDIHHLTIEKNGADCIVFEPRTVKEAML